jgi:hypothetical protein
MDGEHGASPSKRVAACRQAAVKSLHSSGALSPSCTRYRIQRCFPGLLQKCPYAAQNSRIHHRRQQPRLRILLAWMVDAKQPQSRFRKIYFRTMRKSISHSRRNRSAVFQNSKKNIPSYFPQREHRSGTQYVYLALQISATVENFGRQRFVVRRGATRCRRDAHVSQRQPVIGGSSIRLVSKTGVIQGLIQEDTGAIARKHPARAIRAVRARRQSDNQQLRLWVTESGHRFTPIRPIPIRQALLARDAFPIFHQPRALPAGDDLFV